MAGSSGLSTLSTAISLGLSSVVTVLPFPPTYSTMSSIFSTLILRDFYSGSTAILFIQGEDLMISSMSTTSYQQYPQRLNYINSSTISTFVFEAKGSTLTSSIIVSSINLTSSFVAVGLDTKRITAQSTLVSSLFLTDYGTGSNTLLLPQGNTLSLMVGQTLQPFLLTSVTGLSSMSTSYGFAFQNLTQGIALSTVSTSISLGLSTIAIDAGLRSVETYGNIKIDYNTASSISTLYVFTSTATISTINTVSFSTALLSTVFVSAQQVNVSSFRTWNANISTFLPNLISTTEVLGLLTTASSISTGALVVSSIFNGANTVSSILYASSFFIYNNNTVISTVSANRVYFSTVSFMGQNSTLFASSGQLYSLFQPIVGGAGTTSNGFFSFGSGGGTVNLFRNFYGVSTPQLIASTIFIGSSNISANNTLYVGMTGLTSTTLFTLLQSTSYTCSFTVDVQGIISSGIYSTTMNEFRVRYEHPAQSWSYAAVNYNTTASNTLSIQQSIGRVNDGTNRLFPSTTVMSYIGLSMPAGYTYALEWDGHKLLAGGFNSAAGQAGSNLICYLPPYTWRNSNFQNTVTPPTNTYNMWMAKYPTYVTSGFIAVYAIAYNGDQWIATGNATTQAGTIKYSFDGLSWNNCASGGWVPDTTASSNTWAGGGGYCVKWNGYMWVCGGSNASAGTGSGLQYSYDGINWTNTNLTTVGVMKKIVYFNNCIWVAAGTYADYGLKYSYDGINWTNCTVAGTTYSAPVLCLEVNTNYIMYANNNPSPLAGTTFRSYNGINFTRPDAVDLLYKDPIFDGNNWLVNSAGAALIVQNLTSNLSGGFGQNLSNTTTAIYNYPYAACTHSNINPSMTMSNLKVYGNTFINIYNSTNTIVGFANSAYGGDGGNGALTGQGYNMHLERQNHLNFNNVLKIQQHLSSQVIIDSPGNPNAMRIANLNRFARATLDVLCTINVANATMFRGLKQMGAPAYPSSLGPTDANYNVYIAGSSFLTNIAIGKDSGSNSIYYNGAGASTPQSFFDIYCASTNFANFRETTCNTLGATGMKNLLNATNAHTVTCYPMMDNTGNSRLTYFWKRDGNVFSNVDLGFVYFTGQHPTNCLDVPFSNVDKHVGQLVSVIDQGYTTYTINGTQITGKDAILTTSATPITKITTIDKDPNVFGVVTNMFNSGINSDGSLNLYTSTPFNTFLFDRIMVNALGEGALWVTNYNGNISNGDYICSSPIPGLARKQDDNRLWNYTVAKATMSCDFNPGYISAISTFVVENEVLSTFVSCIAYECDSVEFNGSSFSTAFIGCTYHCA